MIRAFDAETELTLSEVARRTGLTRAAARRFLLTLAELGYVRTDGRAFSLTPRMLELGYAYLSSLSLPEIAEPHLERLVAEVHESSSVSVLDGDDDGLRARVPTGRIMSVAINVGTRFPAYATSMGRVLLAALPDDELDAYLAARGSGRCTAARSTTAGRCAPSSTGCAPRATRSSTRSSRRGCARWRRRSATRRPVVAAINVSAHASRDRARTRRGELLPPLLATARRSRPTWAISRRRRLRAHRRSEMERWLSGPSMALERLTGARLPPRRRPPGRRSSCSTSRPARSRRWTSRTSSAPVTGRRVGRASIYRALDELGRRSTCSPRVEVGDGVARYEPQRPHADARTTITSVCDGCGTLTPFQDDALEKAIHGLAARVAFDVSDDDVTLGTAAKNGRAAEVQLIC